MEGHWQHPFERIQSKADDVMNAVDETFERIDATFEKIDTKINAISEKIETTQADRRSCYPLHIGSRVD
jgi:uncharacterized protein Yka (UPF0111/DUF47 family)